MGRERVEEKGGEDGEKKEDSNMKQWKVWGRRAMVWDSGKYKMEGEIRK